MQNPDGGISYFRISGQFLIKINFHKSRTGDDIETKLGPVTKPVKRNKEMSKNPLRLGLSKTLCFQEIFV